MMDLTGDKALDAALRELTTGAQYRVMGAGVRAALTEIAKAIRRNVKPSVRPAIASRFKRSKKDGVSAKVGGGVGKRKRRAQGRKKGQGGVGISKHNVHWYLMGTGPRVNYTRGNAYRGMMPSRDSVQRGFEESRAVAMKKCLARMVARLEKEAAKAAVKHRGKG